MEQETRVIIRSLLQRLKAGEASYWVRRAPIIIALAMLPALAYAVTANLTLHVTGTGTIPAPAQAAGFTTLALNEDFSQPFYATRSNWLDCAGATSPLWYRAWMGFTGSTDPPCSSISQEIDPLTSQPALRMHYQGSYFTVAVPGVANQGPLQTVDNSGNGRRIPPNAYFEVEARYDNISPYIQWDIWSYTTNGTSIEWDGIETWGGGIDAGSCVHNNEIPENGGNYIRCIWDTVVPASGTPTFEQYHKYAWRVTQSGTINDGFWCAYIDGISNGCITWLPTANEATGIDQTLIFLFGRHCRGTDTATCTAALASYSGNMWIKSAKVYSCAGINSGAKCFTSANP
jgi:hypothetical protein